MRRGFARGVADATLFASVLTAAVFAAGWARAAEPYTTAKYDLSALPAYKPEQMALAGAPVATRPRSYRRSSTPTASSTTR